jgi:SAM-dependent methyltransferase
VCASASTLPLFSRDNVPVLLNRLYESAEAARRAVTGRLVVVGCHKCGLVFNAAFDSSLSGYDGRYENDQSNSAAFCAHMRDMADRILDVLIGRSNVVVEIGCGQARFLAMLVERASGRISTAVGYDPAWRGGPSLPTIRVEARNFDADALRRLPYQIDAIVSRHVIEHLANPVGFLNSIRAVLPSSWNGRLFLEMPRLEWIASRRTLHDFFHEHCNYFGSRALAHALARGGFRALKIDPVFDGQYHWVEAVLGQAEVANSEDTLVSLMELATYEKCYTTGWQRTLTSLKPKGNIAIWGAGAKGVTFANLADPESRWISCLIDINPGKQNRFAPVTAHPVRHPREAMREGLAAIIIMNPNYRAEIEAELERAGRLPTLLHA